MDNGLDAEVSDCYLSKGLTYDVISIIKLGGTVGDFIQLLIVCGDGKLRLVPTDWFVFGGFI